MAGAFGVGCTDFSGMGLTGEENFQTWHFTRNLYIQ